MSSVLFLAIGAMSCSSLSSVALSAVADSLSGTNKKGVPMKKRSEGSDPLAAITGERDITLVSDFFPTALVLYELLHAQNPDHLGLSAMTGQLNIMYANVFVQTPAERLPVDQFNAQQAEYERAQLHYLRGRDYCLEFLEGRHTGIRAALFSGDDDTVQAAVALLDENDVSAAYWAGAGWLGAFSLDPLNGDMMAVLNGPVQLLERAAALSPDYDAGAIWELLFNFYVSAPDMFGGDYDRGMTCYAEALRASGGKTPGPYITYATAICMPQNDSAGFEEMLNTALAINADDEPSSRLVTLIQQERARYLLLHKDNYFVIW